MTDPIGDGRRKVESTARQIESAIASIVGCSGAVPLIARLART